MPSDQLKAAVVKWHEERPEMQARPGTRAAGGGGRRIVGGQETQAAGIW